MAARIDPAFLVAWVRVELEEEAGLFDAVFWRA